MILTQSCKLAVANELSMNNKNLNLVKTIQIEIKNFENELLKCLHLRRFSNHLQSRSPRIPNIFERTIFDQVQKFFEMLSLIWIFL